MITAGLDVFDRTLYKTYDWLADHVKHILPAEVRELGP
jgi:hypothetical protein